MLRITSARAEATPLRGGGAGNASLGDQKIRSRRSQTPALQIDLTTLRLARRLSGDAGGGVSKSTPAT